MAVKENLTLNGFLKKNSGFVKKLRIFRLFHVGYFFKTQFVSIKQTKSVRKIFQECFSELDCHFQKLKYEVFFGVTLHENLWGSIFQQNVKSYDLF